MLNYKRMFFILVNVNFNEIKINFIILDFYKRNLNFQLRYIENFHKINSFKGFSTP